MTNTQPETDQPAAAADPLDSIFCPKSIAILGVTKTAGTVPHDIFANILSGQYTGVVYPVAPGKRSVSSVRAYRYVSDIEDDVDLAVIVFPASVVDKALAQCGRKGVRGVIIISAGFREVGQAGAKLEQQVKDICREHDMALIGPNCLGVINTDPAVKLNASFARKMPAAGRIAFLSQSGALCTAVLDYARGKGIGFSKFVSFGNKADVTEIDLLHYLYRDDQTDVILLYLEELRDGRGLIEAARQITRGDNPKPILAIKSGRTPQGASAAASHTGSLASEDRICDAVFKEAGIIRASSIEDLFNSGILLAYQPLSAGNRLAIVTNAGGPGVMATDAATHAGLTMARFNEETTKALSASLPAAANISNPVDVIGDARSDRYESALESVLADPNVDEVLVILTPQSMTDIDDIARSICDVHARVDKPIVCSFMGASDVASGINILQADRIPHYVLPEWACQAMADAQRVGEWRSQAEAAFRPLPVDKAAAGDILNDLPDGYLREDQALAVLQAYGFPVPAYQLCGDVEETVAFSETIDGPTVLRVVSPEIVHKFDVHGVALNLPDAQAVRTAHDRMMTDIAEAEPNANVAGVIVREMIPNGHEVILGAKRDVAFGPTLMFGLGGLFVETFKDVTFALAPVTAATAGRMVREVKSFSLLEGARGIPPADIENVEQCLVRLGQLVADFDRIVELDINPLIVGATGAGSAVADVRIRLG